MVGSFLDCLGAMSIRLLLKEATLDEGTSEGTCWLIETLLEVECLRGGAVGHLLSSAITMDCNLKLIQRNALLPLMILPSALTTEAYQLLFDPSGSRFFGEALSAL